MQISEVKTRSGRTHKEVESEARRNPRNGSRRSRSLQSTQVTEDENHNRTKEEDASELATTPTLPEDEATQVDSEKVNQQAATSSRMNDASSPVLSSSTPRRRKDPLANLQSNLSPKYIGFTTPPSSNTKRRSMRREISHSAERVTSDDKSHSRNGDISVAEVVVSLHRTTATSPLIANLSADNTAFRKPFLSPIDKLLKNGSTTTTATTPTKSGFETSRTTKTKHVENSQRPRRSKALANGTNLEKEAESATNTIEEIISQRNEILNSSSTNSETETVEENATTPAIEADVPDKSELAVNTDNLFETTKSIEDFEIIASSNLSATVMDNSKVSESEEIKKNVKLSVKDNSKLFDNDKWLDVEKSSAPERPTLHESVNSNILHIKTEDGSLAKPHSSVTIVVKSEITDSPTTNAHLNANKINEDGNKSESKPHISPSSPAISATTNSIKFAIKLDRSESDAEETPLDTIDTVAAKSPSAVSIDSAKGSSVINDASPWMSFAAGDVFWGQIYTYCYWPCMVCPDPDGKTITTLESGRNGLITAVSVHVRFFADNGRRNWVKSENLLPYVGLESYKARVQEVINVYGKKSSKHKLFVPKKNKLNIWHEAISEANLVVDTVYDLRLKKFNEIYEKSKSYQLLERKRRKSMFLPMESTSDIGSLYDSTDNLFSKQQLTAIKRERERSVSPYSPAYSPVKPASSKRRKLSTEEKLNDMSSQSKANENEQSNDNEYESERRLEQQQQPTSSTVSHAQSPTKMQDMELFNNIEFKKLYLTMRDYVLEQNQDDKLEKSLVVAVRNIWALKQINRKRVQQQLLENSLNEDKNEHGTTLHEVSTVGGAVEVTGPGSVKRLSKRLKNLMVSRSLALSTPGIEQRNILSTSSDIKPLTSTDEKPRKPLNRPIEEVIDDIFELDPKYLFKGLSREPICKYCLKSGGMLVRCAKDCQAWLHKDCIGKKHNQQSVSKKNHRRSKNSISQLEISVNTIISNDESIAADTAIASTSTAAALHPHITAESTEPDVVCQECALEEPSKCSVCQGNAATQEELVTCNMPQCFKSFHPACCKYWPQSKITKSKNSIESFRCPSHVCHTCVSDDPKAKFHNLTNSKITKCVKCPASYHTDSTCIPAGSQIINAAYIICPRHTSSKADVHVNVNWCFICVGGGNVVCCETCPTAVHAACLNIPIDPNEAYICEECESGRLPLYGEMVWAKFNSFRWWPAIILPPTEIPQNILRKSHSSTDFVVRFFGTHDHGWISRRRVYLYLEGDSSEPPKSKSHLDQSYNRGVVEAKQIYEIVKLKKQQQQLSNENKEKLHPQPYIRIKANRAVPPVRLHIDLEKVNKCECSAYSENPCGPDTDCLNRVLYHECNPKLCPAGERCENQMFESKVSPRLDVIYMKERGFGLVCREAISAGTFVIEYVGEIINDDEFRERMSQKSVDRDENFYFLSVEKDYIIDAGPKGNMARFMNHSCDPNCETQKWSVNGLNRVGLFSIKDIPENTELTFNYHWDELLGSEKKTCYCGAAKCAGQIGSKYKEEKQTNHLVVSKKAKGKPLKSRKKKPLKRLHNKLTAAASQKTNNQVQIRLQTPKSTTALANTAKKALKEFVKSKKSTEAAELSSPPTEDEEDTTARSLLNSDNDENT